MHLYWHSFVQDFQPIECVFWNETALGMLFMLNVMKIEVETLFHEQ